MLTRRKKYAQMVFDSIHYGATVFSKVVNAVCIISHFFIYLDAIHITLLSRHLCPSVRPSVRGIFGDRIGHRWAKKKYRKHDYRNILNISKNRICDIKKSGLFLDIKKSIS